MRDSHRIYGDVVANSSIVIFDICEISTVKKNISEEILKYSGNYFHTDLYNDIFSVIDVQKDDYGINILIPKCTSFM